MKQKMSNKSRERSLTDTELYDKITKIENEVIQKIQKIKNIPKINLCPHLMPEQPESEPYDQNVNYYDRFWKAFLFNEVSRSLAQQMQQQNRYCEKRIKKIEELFSLRQKELEPFEKPSKRRHRQTQQLFIYTCQLCDRAYKDEDTLLIHNKIKHPINLQLNQEPIINNSQNQEFDGQEVDK